MSAVDGDMPGRETPIHRSQAELAAAVRETESGVLKIIDTVGRIMDCLDANSKHAPTEVRNLCTSILEACSFQDIVGQRLVKIGKLLSSIEAGGHAAETVPFEAPRVSSPASGDAPLDGPALAGEGLSQEDVERMFNEQPSAA